MQEKFSKKFKFFSSNKMAAFAVENRRFKSDCILFRWPMRNVRSDVTLPEQLCGDYGGIQTVYFYPNMLRRDPLTGG